MRRRKPVLLDRQLVKGLEVLREKMDKPEGSQQVAASQPDGAKARTAG